mgnify:CR=1 FL=1
MRLGLVSDSHGEVLNLHTAARILVNDWRVDVIAHLGDECEDAAVLKEYPVEVIQVPGVYCEHYRDPAVTNRLLRELAGYRILFTHTAAAHKNDLPGDPDPAAFAAEGNVEIVAFGHTHIPEIKVEGKVLWVNPGHLKDSDSKGFPPSFAVLELKTDGVTCRIVNLRTAEVVENWQGELKG